MRLRISRLHLLGLYLGVPVGLMVGKLLGHNDFSWWVLTVPFWGPVALVLVLLTVVLAGCAFGLCLAILGFGAAMRTMVEAAAKAAVEHNRKMRQEQRIRETVERN